MLQLMISEKPEQEFYDENKHEFIYLKGHKAFQLNLEHSLISISKWESKWKKPFLMVDEKHPMSKDEFIDYIRCMTTNKGVDDDAYNYISNSELKRIRDYITDPCTATKIYDFRKSVPRREIITSELIYYWMIACDIPHEYEKWHLNRLLTLIRICNIKQTPEQKMSMNAIYAQNRALNEQRRAKYNSPG